MFKDSKMHLKFYAGEGVVNAPGLINLDNPLTVSWLEHMVDSNPDFIFFLTIETTDVFAPEAELVEIDFNTIVNMTMDGVLNHTYSPNCPKGCYGHLDDCYYKMLHNA